MRTVLINAISGSREFRYLANPALTGETNYLKWYWLTLKSVASSGPEQRRESHARVDTAWLDITPATVMIASPPIGEAEATS